MVAYTTQLSGLEADGCRLRARSLLSRVLHGKRLVFRLEWPAALHAKLRASRWTPFPKPAHFHFLEGMAVPTSSQQLLCSSAYHAAISRPSQRVCFECGGPFKPGQLKSQGRKATLARGRDSLPRTEAAARQDPRVIDARVSIVSRPGRSAAFSVVDLQGPPTLEPST